MSNFGKIVTAGIALGAASLAAVLLVPPIRDRFFMTKLWPWSLPWDITAEELQSIEDLARPGDVVVESNLHGYQWMALCAATTGTTWVHAALVDDHNRLLTVHGKAIEADWDIYLGWGSTRLALVRPPYSTEQQPEAAIAYARTKLGVSYDPTFNDHSGNCNGLVGSALSHTGIDIQTKNCFGRTIYAPDCFFHIPEAEIIWITDRHRLAASP